MHINPSNYLLLPLERWFSNHHSISKVRLTAEQWSSAAASNNTFRQQLSFLSLHPSFFSVGQSEKQETY